MGRRERIEVCYWHASLRHLQHEALTNASLRGRFGVDEESRSLVSRYIRDAVKDGVIKPLDPDTSPKHMKYLPWWA